MRSITESSTGLAPSVGTPPGPSQRMPFASGQARTTGSSSQSSRVISSNFVVGPGSKSSSSSSQMASPKLNTHTSPASSPSLSMSLSLLLAVPCPDPSFVLEPTEACPLSFKGAIGSIRGGTTQEAAEGPLFGALGGCGRGLMRDSGAAAPGQDAALKNSMSAGKLQGEVISRPGQLLQAQLVPRLRLGFGRTERP
mmetsp:Transcript_84358/g.220303  ORF Transcript_84358/g.220303 Transcript_84358/m.220303 type:complete len:196 (+) Transcript_84358:203-790(+)